MKDWDNEHSLERPPDKKKQEEAKKNENYSTVQLKRHSKQVKHRHYDNDPAEFISTKSHHRGFDDVAKKIQEGVDRIDDKDREALKEKYSPKGVAGGKIDEVKGAVNSPEVNAGAAVAGEPTKGIVKQG
jgi:hypothetical protein